MNARPSISMLGLAAAIAACGADYDALWINRSSSEVSVNCGADRDLKIVLPNARSWSCYGYQCPGTDGYVPGSSECASPTTNPLASTCAETFFDCFQPSGTCTVSTNAALEWSGGAKIRTGEFSSYERAFVPAESEDPCILEKVDSTSDESSFLVRPH